MESAYKQIDGVVCRVMEPWDDQWYVNSILVGGLTCNWKLTIWYTGIRVLPGVTQHRVYVGNLSYDTTAKDLERFFLELLDCDCVHVSMVEDRDTLRPRGFGFVEFATEQAMEQAVGLSNGTTLDGRILRVSQWSQLLRGGPRGRQPG
jgi:RNA recognition motif. (a.k.a. RRM, RBD, or RNP domain)